MTTPETGASGANEAEPMSAVIEQASQSDLRRAFRANRDLPAALSAVAKDSPVFRLPMQNPVVQEALRVCERQERAIRSLRAQRSDAPFYCCPACADHGQGRADWAGALFLHLLHCERFAESLTSSLELFRRHRETLQTQDP